MDNNLKNIEERIGKGIQKLLDSPVDILNSNVLPEEEIRFGSYAKYSIREILVISMIERMPEGTDKTKARQLIDLIRSFESTKRVTVPFDKRQELQNAIDSAYEELEIMGLVPDLSLNGILNQYLGNQKSMN